MRLFGLVLAIGSGLLLLVAVPLVVFNVRVFSPKLLILGQTKIKVENSGFSSWMDLIEDHKTNKQYLIVLSKKGKPARGDMQLTHSLTNDSFLDPTFGCEWKKSSFFGRVRVINVVFEESRYNNLSAVMTFNKGLIACIENAALIGATDQEFDQLTKLLVDKIEKGDTLPFGL